MGCCEGIVKEEWLIGVFSSMITDKTHGMTGQAWQHICKIKILLGITMAPEKLTGLVGYPINLLQVGIDDLFITDLDIRLHIK